LNDSVERSQNFSVCNILLASIESAAAFSLIGVSATFLTVGSVFMTPCFVIPVLAIKLISHAPGISSFESVKKFNQETTDALNRIVKIHLVAIPVIFLFLLASGL
jgi:hypothetical protein